MSKYKILPVKKDKQTMKEWQSIPDFLPKHPFCLLMNAPPKSGKSNLLMNLLFNTQFDYVHKFVNIFWCSPTVRGDKTTQKMMDIINDEGENEIKETIKIFTDDDLDNMDSLIKAFIQNQNEEKEPTLIILDDCIGKMKNGEFGKLCAKYRHFNFSIIGISQSFKAFDTICRNCASHFILFKTYNEKEEEKMMEELNGFPNIKKYYTEATKDKYNFLYINVEEQIIMKNFDDVLWSRDNISDVKHNDDIKRSFNNEDNNEEMYCECKGKKKCDKPLDPEKLYNLIIYNGN